MIKRLLRLPFRTRRGSALVMVAVAMPALLGMVALAVDLGGMYAAHAQAQRAADSAALAGASAYLEVGVNPPATAHDSAVARAMDYATKHTIYKRQVQPADVNIEFLPADWKVRVTVRRGDVPTWFARIFGVYSVPISATAAAVAADAGNTNDCVKPFAIPDLWDEGTGPESDDTNSDGVPEWQDPSGATAEVWGYNNGGSPTYVARDGVNPTGWGTDYRNGDTDSQSQKYWEDYGRPIPIDMHDPHGTTTPSFWYPWVIPGSNPGAQGLTDNIVNCNTTSVPIDATVPVETKNGLMPTPLYKAFMQLIDEAPGFPQPDPDAYWQESASSEHPGYTTGEVVNSAYTNIYKSPRVITVALFRPEDQDNGKEYMRFVNFALVFLDKPASKDDNIMGHFMGFWVPGSGTTGPGTGSLIKSIRLVE